MEVVKQEIDKGADAVIVKMTGNSNEYSQLKKIQKKVPIMLAGESLAEIKKQSDIPVTEPDQYEMGVALVQKLESIRQENTNFSGKQ